VVCHDTHSSWKYWGADGKRTRQRTKLLVRPGSLGLLECGLISSTDSPVCEFLMLSSIFFKWSMSLHTAASATRANSPRLGPDMRASRRRSYDEFSLTTSNTVNATYGTPRSTNDFVSVNKWRTQAMQVRTFRHPSIFDGVPTRSAISTTLPSSVAWNHPSSAVPLGSALVKKLGAETLRPEDFA
jgi:hypothetical protein